MSDNTMNDKLQGSAASYLRCGGSVIKDVNKRLLLSLPVKKIEIGTHLVKKYKQKCGCFAHFVHLVTTLLKD